MKKYFPAIFLFFSLFSYSQNPLVKVWDYRYGGEKEDYLFTLQQTLDGGYILGGWSISNIACEKTQPKYGNYDFWIVKLDSLGTKIWDKDFGGTDHDYLFSLIQTSDGGFLLGGSSISNISGDKTQASQGGFDYWIIKLDSNGLKMWDRDFGGTADDDLLSINQTSDGGYILGGYSFSGIGGDKTEPAWAFEDYWIIKIDSIGTKLWDKNFGGTGIDRLYYVEQTLDGGYIMSGQSSSNISGDKTQASWGNSDYWVIKTDSTGNKMWDKDFGGTGSDLLSKVLQTFDGGYILAGISNSNISGDKTNLTWGGYDFWIVKIDSLGNKIWDRDYGGTDTEELFNISETFAGGLLISGDSNSPISGDKSESNLGPEQSWIIEVDSTGSKIWDKTVFTLAQNERSMAIQSQDGCYVIANFDNGGSGIGGEKSQASCGGWADYWAIKFCPLPMAFFSISDSLICPSSCIDFKNLSFYGNTFQWNFPGAAIDTSTAVNPTICYPISGNYDVQLIASNASGSDTLLISNFITVHPIPGQQSIIQNSDTLFAISGASLYQWYFNGNLISGATDYYYIFQSSGDYNVIVTDSNGCEVEAAIFNVIANYSSLFKGNSFLTISPTPATKEVLIRSSNLISRLSVLDVIGNEQFSKTLSDYQISFEVTSLTSGIYFINIQSELGVSVKMLIKE